MLGFLMRLDMTERKIEGGKGHGCETWGENGREEEMGTRRE